MTELDHYPPMSFSASYNKRRAAMPLYGRTHKLVSAAEAASYYDVACSWTTSTQMHNAPWAAPGAGATPNSNSNSNKSLKRRCSENAWDWRRHHTNNYHYQHQQDDDIARWTGIHGMRELGQQPQDAQGREMHSPRPSKPQRVYPLHIPQNLKQFIRNADLPAYLMAPELRYRKSGIITIGKTTDHKLALAAGVNERNWLVIHVSNPPPAGHPTGGGTGGMAGDQTIRQLNFVHSLLHWLRDNTEHIVGLHVFGRHYEMRIALHADNEEGQEEEEHILQNPPAGTPPTKGIATLLALAPKHTMLPPASATSDLLSRNQ